MRNRAHWIIGCLAAGLAVSLAAPAAADVKKNKEAGVSIWVPDTWKSKGTDKVLTMADPKDEVSVTLVVLAAADLEKAVAALDAELAKFATDVTVTRKGKESKLNGMPVIGVDATGKVKGIPVDIGVGIVKTPTGKAILLFGIVATAKAEAHKAMLGEILNSLKPL